MDKLIELLKEFNKEKGWHPGLLYEGFGVRRGDLNFIFNHSEFPFIKWLVENNKIDFTKDCIVEFGYYGTEWYCDKYDNILMNLSIQDDPIDFLISVLR